MRIGDALKPTEAADATGLSPELCRTMLLGLERAGLMTRQHDDDRFIRCSLDMVNQ